MDKRYKLIRKIAVTNAAVADTTVFEALLDSSNTSKALYADRGYPSAERESALKQAGWQVHIQRRGYATKGISRREEAAQPQHRQAARPRRACVRRAGADGRKTRAMPGHRTHHLRVASQNGQLQLEAPRLLERARACTVLKRGKSAGKCSFPVV
nr:transposase [Rugamonas rubra]